ncbi:SWI/SNF complex component snf12 [Nowakowskiella sp. JEL0407]|nr:SWI/SNF complex component snf12 [Nowakowskiella sp. JEL0407]
MKEVPNVNQIVELDEKINGLIQQITISKMKRDFMKAFVDDPVGFINAWIASQSRDLEGLMGENHVNREEMRRSEFYNQQWVHEAVFQYLNTR